MRTLVFETIVVVLLIIIASALGWDAAEDLGALFGLIVTILIWIGIAFAALVVISLVFY